MPRADKGAGEGGDAATQSSPAARATAAETDVESNQPATTARGGYIDGARRLLKQVGGLKKKKRTKSGAAAAAAGGGDHDADDECAAFDEGAANAMMAALQGKENLSQRALGGTRRSRRGRHRQVARERCRTHIS